jgi:hypothetical protein
MILEQAYENTLKAHVVYASDTMAVTNSAPGVSTSSPVSEIGSPQTDYDAISPALTLASSNTSSPANEVKPLMAGSSTALVAILDQVATSTTSTGIRLGDPSLEDAPDHAVLRIAHLGDSMGMLIRGDEIVWRSEEMWSRVRLLCDTHIIATKSRLPVQYPVPTRTLFPNVSQRCQYFYYPC